MASEEAPVVIRVLGSIFNVAPPSSIASEFHIIVNGAPPCHPFHRHLIRNPGLKLWPISVDTKREGVGLVFD
jgi:hypothetical protein